MFIDIKIFAEAYCNEFQKISRSKYQLISKKSLYLSILKFNQEIRCQLTK